MACPFLIWSEKAIRCEALQEKDGIGEQTVPLCVCENEWLHLCPHFIALLESRYPVPEEAATQHQPPPAAWRLRHINRIGGLRALLSDLS